MELDKVDVVDFLSALGIRQITDDGEEVQYSCPFPYHGNGDATPSAYMNKKSTAFFCHGCKAKGNAIHFLAQLEGISPLLSAKFIRERYGRGFIDPGSGGGLVAELESMFSSEQEEQEEVNPEIEYELDPLNDEARDYLEKRGFNVSTIRRFEIGIDPITGRIAIPIRDFSGRLVGFKARSYKQETPKYLVLGDRKSVARDRFGFKTYEKSQVLFSGPKDGYPGPGILCEGEFNAIALFQMGRRNALAISGSQLSQRQCELLKQKITSVTLFFDDDAAGNTCTADAIQKLEPYMPVRVVEPHEMDPADYLAAGLNDECVRLIDEAKSTTELWLASS